MVKVYKRIYWENYPNDTTPVNEQNLNRIDGALDSVDDRIIQQDVIKLSKIEASRDLVDWTMDEKTGIITITRRNGEKILFDLNIEKIPVSFALSDDGILTMTTDDGTMFTANIGAMIPVLTFENSDTIIVSVSGTGINKTYSFGIKDGSVTDEKLRPDYLADIKLESAKAEASALAAEKSANEAEISANRASQAAEAAGWADFDINDKGHLIFTKTDNLETEFNLTNNGRLEVTLI